MTPRAANDDRLPALAAEVNDVERVTSLRKHTARQDQVGPVKVGVSQLLGVSVKEPSRPRLR